MADCSKTLDYSKEFERMCDYYDNDCSGCPLEDGIHTCDCFGITQVAIDIVQKWSDKHPDIKPCPFCGKTDCVEVTWEDEDEDEDEDEYLDSMVQVVCNYNKGGCGSSSGFKKTKEEALELWNERVDVK